MREKKLFFPHTQKISLPPQHHRAAQIRIYQTVLVKLRVDVSITKMELVDWRIEDMMISNRPCSNIDGVKLVFSLSHSVRYWKDSLAGS